MTIPPLTTIDETCAAILDVLLPHRRAEPDPGPGHRHDPTVCFADQMDQLRPFVAAGEPILFTVPGFPCKSPNPDKVLGHRPDLGEELALRFLDGLCDQVTAVYPPGARFLICSDGHVFSDLIGVPDHHVDEYMRDLRAMIADAGYRIDTLSLDDIYPDLDYQGQRQRLEAEYPQPLAELRAEVKGGGPGQRLYLGITRFLVEDRGDWQGTRSALQRESRQRAYGVIQRSRAWGELIADRYPRQVRLSIHPQPCGTPKFGIALLEIDNPWTTPWHSVTVRFPDGRYALMRHRDAAAIGRPVLRDDRPSHYVADQVRPRG